MPSLLTPLSDPVFRPLYAAQMIGLIGFGLSTVALSLLAFQLEPDNAGQVLGIALGLKMVTFVLVAPMFASAAAAVSRKKLLIWLDLVRAVAIGAIAFVDQVWQVYVLIVVLSAAAVAAPVQVHYAWAAVPKWSLVGGTGIPAAPFRLTAR